MRIYVAGDDQQRCFLLAETLEREGYKITSSHVWGWQNDKTDEQRRRLAETEVSEVRSSDALVLMASDRLVKGGKFVEAGIALGCGHPVVVLGRLENLLLHHPEVTQVIGIVELLNTLGRLRGRLGGLG